MRISQIFLYFCILEGGAHRNLASLALNSDSLHDLVQSVIVQPFVEECVTFGPMGVRERERG
jgi:hypothetical protein